ncbi:hypothetical protein KKB99_06390 [bacterium]|nr:hypothetical protein [bacterium]MBU1025617.1 hypothetical protein [bacterium]
MSVKNQHHWRIINLLNGYLVTERCVETGARQSFFSSEDTPPIDNYTDGEYTWKYLGSAQAVKFDLENRTLNKVINLKNVLALMLCTECDSACNACQLSDLIGETKTWVYVALSEQLSSDRESKITKEETQALTDYFNSRIKTPGKQILFVPDNFIKNMDTCAGEIIADVGLTDIY